MIHFKGIDKPKYAAVQAWLSVISAVHHASFWAARRTSKSQADSDSCLVQICSICNHRIS
jgi:hypothetical protein